MLWYLLVCPLLQTKHSCDADLHFSGGGGGGGEEEEEVEEEEEEVEEEEEEEVEVEEEEEQQGCRGGGGLFLIHMWALVARRHHSGVSETLQGSSCGN